MNIFFILIFLFFLFLLITDLLHIFLHKIQHNKYIGFLSELHLSHHKFIDHQGNLNLDYKWKNILLDAVLKNLIKLVIFYRTAFYLFPHNINILICITLFDLCRISYAVYNWSYII